MNYKFVFGIAMVVYCTSLCGQTNLVPNYSLDTFSVCPNNSSQISYATSWGDANGGSTDYFHACSSILPVPFSYYNYSHNSHSGPGMAGVWMYQVNGNYREYLQVQLVDTLETGVSYWVEFYVLLSHGMAYGVNNVGAYLSSNAIQQPGAGAVISTVIPQIQLVGNPVITDTMQWTRISACYQAVGGEQFITIGNFCGDSITDTAGTMGNYQGAYYFIDDIGVTKVDTLGLSDNVSAESEIQLFPNPARDVVTFQFSNDRKNRELVIYDALGKEVWREEADASSLSISVQEFAEGIYFYSFAEENGTAVNGKFVVSR